MEPVLPPLNLRSATEVPRRSRGGRVGHTRGPVYADTHRLDIRHSLGAPRIPAGRQPQARIPFQARDGKFSSAQRIRAGLASALIPSPHPSSDPRTRLQVALRHRCLCVCKECERAYLWCERSAVQTGDVTGLEGEEKALALLAQATRKPRPEPLDDQVRRALRLNKKARAGLLPASPVTPPAPV